MGDIKFMGLNELREKFLAFFEGKDHLRMQSFPLIPNNDKSLLLINSGMAPLKPYFTGLETPPKKRVTTCQKCIRTNDIENVGYTLRHGTFFEMLGDFSFGDYFKNEIIPWAWEFFTKVLGIPESRLYPSVYVEDDEAFDIWHNVVGIPKERIFRMGKDDNFWEVGLGPCGPCSEIYFDKGEKYGCGKPDCTVGCDCDRYMEVWNLVFTQFCKEEDGSYSKLAFPNIDTGMGLERIAAVMQGVDSIFDVDTIKHILNRVCDIAKVKYNENEKQDVSIRIITDHLRAVTFMTADGIMPSNEGRGYVLRRLLRRAARHGRLLGIQGLFLTNVAESVIEVSGGAYPELLEKKSYVLKVISNEEERFNENIDSGMSLLKEYMEELKASNANVIQGKQAFKLYDTYGFPFELMKEMAEDEGFTVDEEGFKLEMEEQREMGRKARGENTYMGTDETALDKLGDVKTEFIGYEQTECKADILAISVGNELVSEATAKSNVMIVLDRTVFYAESGGQKGDIGEICTKDAVVRITDCIKVLGKFAHIGIVESGTIKVGEHATVIVEARNRLDTSRNHTATHLLQKALRLIVGEHIHQAGSSVSADRLRFDFTHFAPLTDDEINKIQDEVNKRILECIPVKTKECGIDEARSAGAMALFGEKYGDIVRVVSVGNNDKSNYSIELCGGTHVSNTSIIGSFKLVSESGVSAGVRRIEALTGRLALKYYQDAEDTLLEVCELAKSKKDGVVQKIAALVAENKELRSAVEKAGQKDASSRIDGLLSAAETINGTKLILSRIDGLDMGSLRSMCDVFREKLTSGVAVLFSVVSENDEEKVNIISFVTQDKVKSGLNAGKIVKALAEITGGGGGGRPDMAQAGGKNKDAIPTAMDKVKEMLA